jgi:aryl-alcohol dehydrogenase-like predicted oxidoreductase
VEHELIPFLEYNGLGLTAWSPLAGGLLSGKYSREALLDKSARQPDTRLAALDFLPFDADTLFHQVEALKEIGAHHNATPAQVALAWLLAKPVVHSVIIGASKPAQLEDNLGAADLVLSAEEVTRIDELGAPAPLYPQWFTRVVADGKRHRALGR